MARLRPFLLAALLSLVAGCGFQPMPVPDPSGLKPGSGLLSGKTGEFTIPLARP